MLSFHYPSNHLLIQPVMHTPVLCQLQLSLLSSQDFFSCYTMINEDASLIVHVITFQHYMWLPMHGCACQISIFKLLCSRSSHYSTKVVSSIAPSFLFSFLSSRPSTNANSTQKSINISVLLVVASGDRHALVIETMQSMLE